MPMPAWFVCSKCYNFIVRECECYNFIVRECECYNFIVRECDALAHGLSVDEVRQVEGAAVQCDGGDTEA